MILLSSNLQLLSILYGWRNNLQFKFEFGRDGGAGGIRTLDTFWGILP